MKHAHTPKKARFRDWHNADIKAALEKAGWSLSRLSQHCGYHKNVIRHALDKPFPAAEKFIAEAIGVQPQEIWPSRYDAGGKPKRPPGRPIRKVSPIKNTTSRSTRNVDQGASV